MAYLHSSSYYESFLPKNEKALHPFNEDNSFFKQSEIPSKPQDSIFRVISIKNKTKAEKILKRLDFFQFFGCIISNTSLSNSSYTYKISLYKNKNVLFHIYFKTSDDFTWNSL